MTITTDVPIPREQHTLPSGAIVELLALGTLKAKHYRQVMRAISQVEGRLGGQALDMTDGVLGMLIASWSVTDEDGQILPIPSVDIDSLDELHPADYIYLIGLPVVGETVELIMQAQRPVVTPDDWDKPMSPTGPSSAPTPRSRGAASNGPAATTGARKSKPSGGRSAGAGPRSK